MEVEPTNNACDNSSSDSDQEVTDHRAAGSFGCIQGQTKVAHGYPQDHGSDSQGLQGIARFPAAAFAQAFGSNEMDIIPAAEVESIETIKSRYSADEWESIIAEETCKLMDEDEYGPYQERYPGIIEYIISHPLPTQNIEKQKAKNAERDQRDINRGEPTIDELNALINLAEGTGNVAPDVLDSALTRQTIPQDQAIGEYQGHGYLRVEEVEQPRGYYMERAQDPDDLKTDTNTRAPTTQDSDSSDTESSTGADQRKTNKPPVTEPQSGGSLSSCIIS